MIEGGRSVFCAKPKLLPRRNLYAWFHEICVRVGPPLLVAAGAAQAQTWPDGGNPSEGATLYDSCVPCHTLNGNGLAGKSVSDLMDKMKAYQSGTFTDAKLLGMQQVLKPLSDKQLLDLAAYINKM